MPPGERSTTPEAHPVPTARQRGSLISAINWMGGLALLLFWLPVFGPLLAGFVGGMKAGSIRTAIIAVFLPALLTGLLAFAGVTYLTDWYGWGILAGVGGVIVSLLNVVPLLGGAIIGELAARFTRG